jgi:hypothetical protein
MHRSLHDSIPTAGLSQFAVNAGFGALIGAGIDALHKGRSPIYVKPAASGVALQLRLRF